MIRPQQLPLDLGCRPALGREDFLLAPANADAVRWLDRWPRWPGPAVVVYGPAGCGKTHLAEVWRQQSGASRLAAADLREPRLPERLLAVQRAVPPPALVLDDAPQQLLSRDEAHGLFHLYNALSAAGGFLLLTAPCPPGDWPVELADLRSRLCAAPAVAIAPPDETLLAALLVKLLADRQLPAEPGVIAYLAARMERSAAAALRLVAALDTASLAQRRPLTIPLARQVLALESACAAAAPAASSSHRQTGALHENP